MSAWHLKIDFTYQTFCSADTCVLPVLLICWVQPGQRPASCSSVFWLTDLKLLSTLTKAAFLVACWYRNQSMASTNCKSPDYLLLCSSLCQLKPPLRNVHFALPTLMTESSSFAYSKEGMLSFKFSLHQPSPASHYPVVWVYLILFVASQAPLSPNLLVLQQQELQSL